MSSLKKKVIGIVADQLGVDKEVISLNSDFIGDLKADSLDTTELMMIFEEQFNFEILEEEAEKLRTVGDVVDYIKEKKPEYQSE